jgi:hypothetical protein
MLDADESVGQCRVIWRSETHRGARFFMCPMGRSSNEARREGHTTRGELRMPGRASVKTLPAEELFTDGYGQHWSPATVTLEWAAEDYRRRGCE